MQLPATYFSDFLAEIRLTSDQRQDAISGHTQLRARLNQDEDVSSRVISTFIQGSYRRATAVRPRAEARSDVDVVVVTNLDEHHYGPNQALDLFVPFLERHYTDQYRLQGRSLGISLPKVDVDLVVTSAPSEKQSEVLKAFGAIDNDALLDLGQAFGVSGGTTSSWFMKSVQAQWKLEALRIPNRETNAWEDTHPLKQIAWTIEKNAACNGHFVNVVKALKWWQRLNSDTIPKPKGYPLEHMIGDNCPDGIESVQEGIVLTLEAMERNYMAFADNGLVPDLRDRGTLGNIMARITPAEFGNFYSGVRGAANTATKAVAEHDICETVRLWRTIFGERFPPPPGHCTDEKGGGGFTKRTEPSTPKGQRFA